MPLEIVRNDISQAYDAIAEKGRMENKAVTKRIAHAYEKALLNRLVSYKRDHLLFFYRKDVSFDNNESERNLRKCKKPSENFWRFQRKIWNADVLHSSQLF